nr:MAG TPA: hypothetical protein [Caudoviricetes sp.]
MSFKSRFSWKFLRPTAKTFFQTHLAYQSARADRDSIITCPLSAAQPWLLCPHLSNTGLSYFTPTTRKPKNGLRDFFASS